MTVAAVTQDSGVARATMYRHFSSADDLVAAAFDAMLPKPVVPPAAGPMRERLTATVLAQAELLVNDADTAAAMSWLAQTRKHDLALHVGLLRLHIVDLFVSPLQAVLSRKESQPELGVANAAEAAAQLLGPTMLGISLGLPQMGRASAITRAVEAFLSSHAERR